MGFVAGVLGVIALIFLWGNPVPTLWWTIFILAIFDFLSVSAVKNSIKMHGAKDKVTKFWLIVATVVQIVTIALSIYALFFKR